MRLEIVPSVLRNINGGNALAGSLKPVMSEGEVLMCQAIGKQGDTVLFSNKGDSFFMARVLGQVDIGLGDKVEMMVSRAAGKRYELKVIDVVQRSIGQTDNSEAKQQNAGVPAALVEGGRALGNAMTILKQNPSVSPKEAMFLASNHLSASPENVKVLSDLVKGEAKVGRLLGEILVSVSSEEKAAAAAAGNNTSAASDNKNAAMQQSVVTEAGYAAGKTVRNDTVQNLINAVPDSAPPADINDKILKTVVSMLYKTDIDEKGAELKKTVADMPERLEELKVLLQNADRKDSGALLKAELIEQQSKMLAQIKQVNCYQVPFVQSDGEQRTAELYVYRRSGRRTAADGEEFSILIGLDTEYMGRVEALVKFRDKNVSLKFGLENQESLGAIIKNESKLAGAIRNMGFNLSEMDAHTLKRRTTVMNAHEVLVPDEPAAPSGIDVRI